MRMTKNKTLNILLSLMLVLGLMPLATAQAFADDEIKQSDENDYMWIGYTLRNNGTKFGRAGFDVKGFEVLDEDLYPIRSTYYDQGYITKMEVGSSSVLAASVEEVVEPSKVYYKFFNNKNDSFQFGREFVTDNVKLTITPELSGRKALVHYHVSNMNAEEKEVKIGSFADAMIGSDDRARIEFFKEKGMIMTGRENGKALAIVPLEGEFTTKWYGGVQVGKVGNLAGFVRNYPDVFYRNPSSTEPLLDTDSCLSYSWAFTLSANQTVTKTAVFLIGDTDVVKQEAEKVLHAHVFDYSANGATITATCSAPDCYLPLVDNKPTASLTIGAPSSLVYDATEKAADLSGDTDELGTPQITYYATNAEGTDKAGEPLAAAPINAGTYWAEMTLGSGGNAATAHVVYTIAKGAPIANPPTGLSATYGQTLADVALPNPSGNTEGTWSWVDSLTTSVGSVGSHTFKANFTPSDTINYNMVENVEVTVTIVKAAPIANPPTGLSATYGQTLADVALPNPSGNTEGSWSWADPLTTSVGNAGSHTFKANFTPSDTNNYNMVEDVEVTVNVEKTNAPSEIMSASATVIPSLGSSFPVSYTLPDGATFGDVTNTHTDFFEVSTEGGLSITPTRSWTKSEWATSVSKEFTVEVNGADNYNDYALTVQVVPAYKQDQTITASDQTISFATAEPTIHATTNGDGELSYHVTSGDAVEVDETTGAITPLKVGTATITITASETDTYAQATKSINVVVERTSLAGATVALSPLSFVYDGKEKKPTVTSVELNGRTLVAGSDYEVRYTNNINVGTASVIIAGKGNYTDSVIKNFKIVSNSPANPSKLSIIVQPKKQLDIRLGSTEPVTLSVKAKAGSGGTLSYQWYSNGKPIKGATKATYTIKNPSSLKPGTYKVYCVVTEKVGNKKVTTKSSVSTIKVQNTASPLSFIQMTPQGKTALALKWNKENAADGYDVFFSRCNHGTTTLKCKKIKTIKGNATTTFTKTKLLANTCYKAYVRPFKMVSGKKVYLAESPQAHAYTNGGSQKYSNPKAIALNSAKVNIKAKASFNLKAKVTLVNAKKKVISAGHAPVVRYVSSDTSVAKVSKTGKIVGVAKGSCSVYAITQNGLRATCVVKVN